jgi:chromosome segregation ATPase
VSTKTQAAFTSEDASGSPMSDESNCTTTPRNKRTVEIFRDLLQVEVRSLISRVTELTSTVGDLFTEVNGIAIQLESSVTKVEQLTGGLSYCREEVGAIRKSISKWEGQLDGIKTRMEKAEEQLQVLQQKLSEEEGAQ